MNYAPGTVDDSNTLFVVQQAGTAYKLDGHAFILALTSILDGHGGINSIVYTAPVAPSLDGTLTITLADTTQTSLTIKNGKGIVSIAKTGSSGLTDVYTISYNDGTTSSFNVVNGAKGDTGDAWYVWIRYAGQQPTQDSDIGTTPDNWMGVYSGTSSTAPTHYTDYQWFQIKGAKGDTGNPATIQSTAIEYQASSSGTTVPSGTWSTTIPSVTQGQYLWTRTTVTFNSGSPVVWYSVSYIAVDGSGAPGTATPLVDSGSGAVGVAMSYARQDHQHPLNVAATGTPQMDGTASRGSEPTYARSDHVHPHDTSKADINDSITKQLSNSFFYGLYGKTINILGDSISNNNDDWPGYIPAVNNITLNNISVGGIKISGDNGLATKTAELSQSADINVLFAGTNDYNAQATIGTIDDTSVSTFYGALNTLFSYFATNIPNSITFIVTPLKRSLVSNAAIPLEIYCNALYKIANKYGAIVLDAYHNAPDWNPLVSDLAHWCNTDKVHPLPAYNQKFLMPYIMRGLSCGSSDIGQVTKAAFSVTVDSTYYITPATTSFEVDSEGYVDILVTGTFRNSGSSAARVVIATLPQWAVTGKQEWGTAGKLTTGAISSLPFYVSGIGGLTIDLLPGDNWCFATLRYKI